MISNLQLLRALAALSVVFYHTAYQLRENVSTEFSGVAIFFVISGFIMTYTTREQQHENFFLNRCIRIAPLYAVITLYAVWAALPYYGLGIVTYFLNNAGASYSYTPLNIVKTLLFIPYKNHVGDYHPIIGAGWTLNLEMYFYLLFGVTLWISGRFAPLLASAFILAFNQIGGMYPGTVLSFYAHDYTYYFVYGIAVFYLWGAVSRRADGLSGFRPLAILFALSVTLALIIVSLFPEIRVPGVMHYLVPPAVVLSALFLHTAGFRLRWRPMLLLGEASYALYLVHLLIIERVNRVISGGVKTSLIGLFLVIALSIVAAIVVHKKIELPMTKFLRRKFVRKADQAMLSPLQSRVVPDGCMAEVVSR